jgi:hypothetical protein
MTMVFGLTGTILAIIGIYVAIKYNNRQNNTRGKLKC